MEAFFNFFTNLKLSDFIFIASGVFTFLAYVTRSMMLLRIMICVSAVLGLVYGVMIKQTVFALGQVALLLINLIQILILVLEKKPLLLPEEWREPYTRVFSAMTPKEFLQLIRSGDRVQSDELELCREGGNAEKLYYIVGGEAEVTKADRHISTLSRGSFVGEMSFLTHKPYTADVRAHGKIDVVSWTHDQLYALREKQSNLYIKVVSILGVDLIRKLELQTEREASSGETDAVGDGDP